MHEYWQFHEPILYSKCDFWETEKKILLLQSSIVFVFAYLTRDMLEIMFNKIARYGTATLYSFVKTFKFNCKFSVPFNASLCISKIICH